MTIHIPVLLDQVISYLDIKPGGWYIDATFGGGSYSLAILKRQANLIAFDLDKKALQIGKKRLASACPPGVSYHLFHLNYKDMDKALKQLKLNTIDGIVFDLGFSSDQLQAHRGFSFQYPQDVLDLRYDTTTGQPAWQIIRQTPTTQLAHFIMLYSQHPHAYRIASYFDHRAQHRPLLVQDIINIATQYPPSKNSKIHPATTLIQALRILTNQELNNLSIGLKKAVSHLSPQGRLVVVSFHSGEDRIVKQFFKNHPQLKIITKKAITPSIQELTINPASRSAKLRVAEKLSSLSNSNPSP